MNLPTIVNVAVSLILIYLILSVLVSGLQESISSILELRAKNLKDSLRTLLSGGQAASNGQTNGTDSTQNSDVEAARKLLEALYQSPLLQGMNQTFRQLPWLRFNRKATSAGPSYISSDVFASSLLNELGLSQLSQRVSEVKLEKFIDRQLYKIILNVIVPARQDSPESESSASEASKTTAFDTLDISTGGLLSRAREGEELTPQAIEQLIDGVIATMQIQDNTGALGLGRFSQLRSTLNQVKQDFQSGNATLETSLSRVQMTLNQYFAEIADIVSPDSHVLPTFDPLYKNLKNLFSDSEKAILLNSLKPNLAETLREVGQYAKTAIHSVNDNVSQDEVQQAIARLDTNAQTLIKTLPQPLAQSLQTLADRAQQRAQNASVGINEFQQEVERWFDHSMARASGSYKRYVRLLSFLLGFLIAVLANADTFNMVSRISQDSVLRAALTQEAEQLNQQRALRSPAVAISPTAPLDPVSPTTPPAESPAVSPPAVSPTRQQIIQDQQDMNAIVKELDAANVALPLGWDSNNVSQQLACSPTGKLRQGVAVFFSDCAPAHNSGMALWSRLVVISGWLTTAIALSLGAPFWFDLLNRLINVRDTGAKPQSTTSERSADQ